MHWRFRGFSLLEVLIVMAVIATMAHYASSVYQTHIARGHRQAAITALYALAHDYEARGCRDERARGERRAQPSSGLARSLPSALIMTDTYSMHRFDDVDEASRPWSQHGRAHCGRYRFEAHPRAEGPQRGDPCGVLSLNDRGQRMRAGGSYIAQGAMPSVQWCWR